MNRRRFLHGGSATLIAMSAARSVYGANDRIVVAAIGTSRNEIGGDGRGTHLARGFTGCPTTHRIADDGEALGLWGREYRPGWEPQV
jgi:hypothetical protein